MSLYPLSYQDMQVLNRPPFKVFTKYIRAVNARISGFIKRRFQSSDHQFLNDRLNLVLLCNGDPISAASDLGVYLVPDRYRYLFTFACLEINLNKYPVPLDGRFWEAVETVVLDAVTELLCFSDYETKIEFCSSYEQVFAEFYRQAGPVEIENTRYLLANWCFQFVAFYEGMQTDCFFSTVRVQTANLIAAEGRRAGTFFEIPWVRTGDLKRLPADELQMLTGCLILTSSEGWIDFFRGSAVGMVLELDGICINFMEFKPALSSVMADLSRVAPAKQKSKARKSLFGDGGIFF